MSCSVAKEECIYQGDALHLGFSRKDNGDLTGWTCYMQVRVESTRQLTEIDREITVKNEAGTSFIDTLTPTETSELKPGKYIVAAEIVNPTTNEGGEVRIRLAVEEQWVIRP